jgi:hypothetical protein
MTPPPTTEPSPGPETHPARSSITPIEVVALLIVVACGLGAWGVGIRTLGYDFDEVTRAHSAWLASSGLRPYSDFFECHPPYFVLLSPVVRGWSDPREVLQALRIVASVGNLLFLGALAAIGASLARDGRRWAWLGLAFFAFYPPILRFLIEFRIDGWGYALAAWSVYRHQRPNPVGPYRDFELGLLTGIATMLFCPKLTILPALIVAFGQIRAWESLSRAVLAALAYAGGVAVAAGLFCLYLVSQGIELNRMFQLLVRYHAVSNANASFHLGLARAILERWTLSTLILAGLLAWGIDRLVRRVRPGAYELALLAWLAAQALLVAYPFKQYFAPWFLFATGYLGFLGQGTATWLRRARSALFLAACLVTGFWSASTAAHWSRIDDANVECRLIRWMDRVAGAEDRVVASPPLHPIDRLDTFFLWFSTDDPGGFDSEQILSKLPPVREYVTETRFREELEAHPPALVVISGDWRMIPYPKGQEAALGEFVRRRGYKNIRYGPAEFAVRPDLVDRARLVD